MALRAGRFAPSGADIPPRRQPARPDPIPDDGTVTAAPPQPGPALRRVLSLPALVLFGLVYLVPDDSQDERGWRLAEGLVSDLR